MLIRRCTAASVILLLLLLTQRAMAVEKISGAISSELPANSALCVVCNNVLRLEHRISRLQTRITGHRSQFDEFTALKMILGPYWNISGPFAFVIPTPERHNALQMRETVVVLQATNPAKFIAGLKNGTARGGITPVRMEGSPAYIASRGNWIFISASPSALKSYMKAKTGLKLPAKMDSAMGRSDITIEGDSRALRKVLFQPSAAMISALMPGHQLAVRSSALRAILHQVGSEISNQLRTALQRSAMTVHLGRQALVINLTNRFHGHSPLAKLIAAQPALPANALAGLPDARYSVLYADSINGSSISRWLKAMLAANRQKRAGESKDIRNFLSAVADHTGTAAMLLPPKPAGNTVRPMMVSPWASGPAVILQYTQHPKAQMRNLAAYFNHRYARAGHGTTRSQQHMQTTGLSIMGYPAMRMTLAAKTPGESEHHIVMINIGSHRILVGVDSTAAFIKSAVTAVQKSDRTICKRPGLAQSIGKILPHSFAAAYLPIARWNQLQNRTSVPKAANALTLGLPPPPAVFSVGTDEKSLNMQLYIPVATLEQSLSGNSAGTLF